MDNKKQETLNNNDTANLGISVVIKNKERVAVCDHPNEELIKTNGYRVLCLKCGRNIN